MYGPNIKQIQIHIILRNSLVCPPYQFMSSFPPLFCFCLYAIQFRYGREDEEVMGLKFCNEAIIALKQIWPAVDDEKETITPLQVRQY